MTQTVRKFPRGKGLPQSGQEEKQVLMEGLERTKLLIDQAYSCFNGASDPDLIESYVFEINALQSRYSYLLKRVRELERPEIAPAAEV